MSVSNKTTKILWAKSGGKCAFPGCGQDLISVDGSVIGQVCHMVSRRKDGPRGGEDLHGADIDGEGNLILLCGNHHTLIDDQWQKYPVDLLKQMKRKHEEEIQSHLNMGQPWDVNFTQIYYMNLRRIEMLAAQQGIELSSRIERGKCLCSLGWNLNALMLEIGELIKGLEIRAGELTGQWENLQVGQFVAIDAFFYTKNIPTADLVQKGRYFATGDLDKDAHLYRKYGEKKCVLTIDPNWLCTSTAFTNFKMGRVKVAGIGMITVLDEEVGIMLVTPYILGTPKTEFDLWLESEKRREIKVL